MGENIMNMNKCYIFFVALFMVNGVLTQWIQKNSGTTIKTIDGVENLAAQTSGVTPDANLESVCFTNNDTGYVVGNYYQRSNEDLILKTTDGGSNWISGEPPRCLNLLTYSFATDLSGCIFIQHISLTYCFS